MTHITLKSPTTRRRFEITNNALDLSGRHIYNLHDIEGLNQLSEIESLNLSYNGLTGIGHLKLPNLRELDLSFNHLYTLKGLDNLSNLVYLDLAHNSITEYLDGRVLQPLKHLKNLKFLYVEDNPFSGPITRWQAEDYVKFTRKFFHDDLTVRNAINAAISNPIIKNLELSTKIRKGVVYLDNVYLQFGGENLFTDLDLVDRASIRKIIINHIPQIDTYYLHFTDLFPNLEVLDLSKNKISSLHKSWTFDDIPSLKILNLNRNNFRTINQISDLFQLQELDFSNNILENIEGIENLSNLKYLSLRGNPISEIKYLKSLTNLKELDLTNTDLSKSQIDELRDCLQCQIFPSIKLDQKAGITDKRLEEQNNSPTLPIKKETNEKENCSLCQGSGVCNYCGGMGRYAAGFCKYCRGTGMCVCARVHWQKKKGLPYNDYFI